MKSTVKGLALVLAGCWAVRFAADAVTPLIPLLSVVLVVAVMVAVVFTRMR